MSASLISILAILLYLTASGLIYYRLASGRTQRHLPSITQKPAFLGIAVIAVILHGIILSQDLFLAPGLNLGIANAASLISCLIALFIVIASLTMPIENIGILALPTAAVTLAIEQFFPGSHLISTQVTPEIKLHILISLLAYSMLTIAAGQALLVALQDRQLRKRQPGGIIRSLPPLQTMESLLFQMIATGFVLHTLALITGFLYVENLFAQHLVHKTVLSIIAWSVFAVLLWGRYYHGWRGKTAIRWTLSGFVLLFLAYFGSKMVIEVIISGS